MERNRKEGEEGNEGEEGIREEGNEGEEGIGEEGIREEGNEGEEGIGEEGNEGEEGIREEGNEGEAVNEGEEVNDADEANERDESDERDGHEVRIEADVRIEANEEDDEEVVDRYEYEIEDGVDNFVDEELVRRNSIPESSDEEEEEYYPRDKVRANDDPLALGTAFFSGYEFKEAVLRYALSRAENIKQDRWDKMKLSYGCGIGRGCKWRVYCSYDEPKRKWVVKTRNAMHSCTPNGKCKLLKGPIIAKLFLDKLRENGNLMPEEIQNQVKDKEKKKTQAHAEEISITQPSQSSQPQASQSSH